MIGHGVLVPGTDFVLEEGKAIFGVELTEPADTVNLKVRDASGQLVHEIEMGAQEAGTLPLAWDGKTAAGTTAADGAYTFEVSATRGGEKIKGATALAFGQVISVSTSNTGVKLNVPGLGEVALADVRQIL
jgi:flagellar basal-body rod modification protein FlgD